MPSSYGSKLADIPAGTKRKYEEGVPRPLKVTISTYGGIVPGARHYFVRLVEEANPFIDCTCPAMEVPHEHKPWDDDMHTAEHQFSCETIGACLTLLNGIAVLIDRQRWVLQDLEEKDFWDEEFLAEVGASLDADERAYFRGFRADGDEDDN